MNKFEGEHPGAETLAAMVDGRLSGKERGAVVEHLDACADCYEVFAETVRFRDEDAPGGRVVDARGRWRRALPWAAAAAAAAAMVTLLVVVPQLGVDPGGREGPLIAGGEPGAAAVLATALADPAAAAARPWDWGAPFAFGGGATSSGFRVGVRLVDLRVAAAGRDSTAAAVALDELGEALLAVGGADAKLAAVRRALEAQDWDDLLAAAQRLEASVSSELDPATLRFGAWAEAGRLAAATGDAAFFSTDAFRGVRAELVASSEVHEDLRGTLEEIAGSTRVEPEAHELSGLAEAFEALVHDGGAP